MHAARARERRNFRNRLACSHIKPVNSIGLPQFSPKIALFFTRGPSSRPRRRQIKKPASSIHSTSAGSSWRSSLSHIATCCTRFLQPTKDAVSEYWTLIQSSRRGGVLIDFLSVYEPANGYSSMGRILFGKRSHVSVSNVKISASEV